MKLSNKVESMQFSPIRKFNPIAQKAKDAGKKVYHLNIGQPDVETPQCFMDAIKNYDSKVIAYAESGGLTVLQDAVTEYFKNYNMDIERKDMIVTTGGSEALNMTFLSILNEGDEVLIAEPFYTNYHTFATAAGGKVVPITTKAEEGYHYAKREQIEPLITEKTKAICCINPGNPTGTVLTRDEMKLIGEIAKEHDLWIIADEVYREFAYDGREATSFGQLDEFKERLEAQEEGVTVKRNPELKHKKRKPKEVEKPEEATAEIAVDDYVVIDVMVVLNTLPTVCVRYVHCHQAFS